MDVFVLAFGTKVSLQEYGAKSVSRIYTGTTGKELIVKFILFVREDKPNNGMNSESDSFFMPFPELTKCVGNEIISNILLIGRIAVWGVAALDMVLNIGGIP